MRREVSETEALTSASKILSDRDPGKLFVPGEARLSDADIVWSGEPHWQSVHPHMCSRFAGLSATPPPTAKIVAFAQRYGPLSPLSSKESTHLRRPFNREPLQFWESESGITHAVLKLIADFTAGKLGKKRHWDILSKHRFIPPKIDFGNDLRLAKSMLVRAINAWFSEASGHTIIGPDLEIRPGAAGVLGVVIEQIARLLANVGDSVACAGCGKRIPQRKGRGNRRYCAKCRKMGRPIRDANRDSRARKRMPRYFVEASLPAYSVASLLQVSAGAASMNLAAKSQHILDMIQRELSGFNQDYLKGRTIIVDARLLPRLELKNIAEELRSRGGPWLGNSGIEAAWLAGPTQGLAFQLC